MSRSDQYEVTLSVDNVDLGVWDTFDGGESDSEETKYRPGGMGAVVSLGGHQTLGNVTLARLYDLARDHARVHWLMSRAGKGRSVISKQPLDPDGNPYGRPLVYRGKLKTVTPPTHDSEDNGPARIEVVVSTEGTVG